MSKRRLMIAIYVIVIASIFCICGSLSAVASNNANPSDGFNESVGKIGDTLYTSDWRITLEGVARKSGNVLVSITVKNVSLDVQYVPSIGNFSLTDRSNKKYDSDMAVAQGTVITGMSANETLVYKVPGNSTTFHLDFNPDIMRNNDSVGFDFTVR